MVQWKVLRFFYWKEQRLFSSVCVNKSGWNTFSCLKECCMDFSDCFVWVDHYSLNCAESQGAEKGGWKSSWLGQVAWLYRKEIAGADAWCWVPVYSGWGGEERWKCWNKDFGLFEHMVQFSIPLFVNQKLNFTLIFLQRLWYCCPNERFLLGLISTQLTLSFGSHLCCSFMLFHNPNPEFSRDT